VSSPLDLVQVPGQPGHKARRVAVEAYVRAGNFALAEATRTVERQQYLYDGYAAGKPGFAPAWNPRDTRRDLAHVRGVAFDISWPYTAAKRSALERAGFVFSEKSEPWHAQLPNPTSYPFVTAAQFAGAGTLAPVPVKPPQEDDVTIPFQFDHPQFGSHQLHIGPRFMKHFTDRGVGYGGAQITWVRNVISAEDTWVRGGIMEVTALMDAMGIQRAALIVDAEGCRVLNPETGAHEVGGTWSGDREILGAIARQVRGEAPVIDYEALATQLGDSWAFSDANLAKIAKAAADEQDARERTRLGK
jgi:hypothetical protein